MGTPGGTHGVPLALCGTKGLRYVGGGTPGQGATLAASKHCTVNAVKFAGIVSAFFRASNRFQFPFVIPTVAGRAVNPVLQANIL